MAETGTVGPTLYTNEPHELRPAATAGKFVCVRLRDERVLSLQPDGTQEYRPAGTSGPFEQCVKVGTALKYAYLWKGGAHQDQDWPYEHIVAWKA